MNRRMNNYEQYAKRPLRRTKGGSVLPRVLNKILVVQLGDIGDLVLSVPTIRSIRENYPNAEIYVAARDKASDLVELCPWADGSIAVTKKKQPLSKAIKYQWHFFSRLRAKKFDMVFDMRTGTRGGFLAILSGAPVRLSFTALADVWRNVFFTHLLFPPMDMPFLHMSHYHLLLLNAYGLKVNSDWPKFVVPEKHDQQVSQLLKNDGVPTDRPIVAIQPFSLWRYKEWGEDKFSALANRIHETLDCSILFCGTKEEWGRVQAMTSGSRQKGIFNFAGKTTIVQYAALLKRCSMFIGCDSAGVHIAAAVGTPTATIYGPSSSAAWAPRGGRHIVVQKEMECVPCRQKGCDNSERSVCLETLTVEEVAQKVEPLLGSIKRKSGIPE